MPNDQSLPATLASAISALNGNTAGSLELFHRRALWKALGPRFDSSAHAKRTKIAIASVEHVLFVWNMAFPTDNTPLDLLQRAKNTELPATEQIISIGDTAWTYMDDLSSQHRDKQIAICVGYAAVQALRMSTQDEIFDDGHPKDRKDDSLDPEEFDSALLSAAAFSNGFTWNRSSNAAHRKIYWTWWLTQFNSL